MIYKKKAKRTVEIIDHVKCDVCKTNYTDPFELQEFQHLNFKSGYGSVFGDGADVSLDICQKCLKRLLGHYLNVRIEVPSIK